MRIRGLDHCVEDEAEVENPYQVGDEVWVRPPNARCDSWYSRGLVTRVVSDQAVEINGVPRHIKHIHRCATPASADRIFATDKEDEDILIQLPARDAEEESDSDDDADANLILPRRSSRIRIPRVCDMCLV